jgi:hypothetical protein
MREDRVTKKVAPPRRVSETAPYTAVALRHIPTRHRTPHVQQPPSSSSRQTPWMQAPGPACARWRNGARRRTFCPVGPARRQLQECLPSRVPEPTAVTRSCDGACLSRSSSSRGDILDCGGGRRGNREVLELVGGGRTVLERQLEFEPVLLHLDDFAFRAAGQ